MQKGFGRSKSKGIGPQWQRPVVGGCRKGKRLSAVPDRMQRRGMILIVVIGVLALLTIIGVIFLQFAGLEHGVSMAYVDLVHARMAARSGIEVAIVNLKQLLTQSAALGTGDWYYYGEDLNHNGALDSGEDADNNGKLDVESCPTEHALSPSFAVTDSGKPALVNIRGKPHGYSGLVGSVYQAKGNQYALKIIDLSSKIYINGGDPSSVDWPYNKVLARILNNLSAQIGLPSDTGTKIIAQRSAKGYACEDDLINVIGLPQYKQIKPYVTVYSWVNNKVVRPVPVENRPSRANWPKATIGGSIYVITQINPGDLTFEPRAPVNVNTASKEVIQALLTGLQGSYIDQSDAGRSRYNGQMSNLGHLVITAPISADQAGQIAKKIIKYRIDNTAFKTWPDFFTFMDTLSADISPALTKPQIDVIKSNANPNNNLNKFNPNAMIYRDVDKTDLTAYSTEFCLGSMGYFDIESVGRVLNQRNDKVAESKITCRVQLLDFWHETTQAEFRKGTISDAAGTIPASDGKSLQIYPESKFIGYDADYDGYILLSTLEAPYKQNEETLLLRASFNATADADVASGAKQALTERDGPFMDRLITSADKVGCVYPDGVYSEAYKCLRFPVKGNINPTCGSIMFWQKPNWDPEISTGKMRTLISMCRRAPGSGGSNDTLTQMFFFMYMPQWQNVNYANMSFYQAYGFYYEGKFRSDPLPYSNCGATPDYTYRPAPHKWQLVTLEWDFQGRGYANCVRFYINGARVPNLRYDRPNYHGDNGAPITGCDDLSDPDNPGIRIGELVNRWAADPDIDPWSMGHMTADSTIDELCVFGGVKSDEFNMLHYKNGRYYNVGDANFTSAPISFTSQVRLATISSTLFLPKDNECRGADIEFAIVGGRQETSAGGETSGRIKNGNAILDKSGGPLLVTGPVSYRIYFKENMQDMEDPILESPVVDDVTITYLLDHPRFIQWIQY